MKIINEWLFGYGEIHIRCGLVLWKLCSMGFVSRLCHIAVLIEGEWMMIPAKVLVNIDEKVVREYIRNS